MAIPKLLEQMRHAVQDTGDTMSGQLVLDFQDPSILFKNSSSVVRQSLTSTEDSTINRINFLDGVNNNGPVLLGNIENPQAEKDAATKDYVDTALENAGGTFYAEFEITTYADVVAAYNAGKTVKALYHNTSSYIYIFDLVTRPTGSNTLYFIAHPYNPYANVYDITCQLTSSSSWSIASSSRRTSVSNPLQYSGTTTISTNPYYRPIRVSTSAPTSSDGNIGDIWIQYFS